MLANGEQNEPLMHQIIRRIVTPQIQNFHRNQPSAKMQRYYCFDIKIIQINKNQTSQPSLLMKPSNLLFFSTAKLIKSSLLLFLPKAIKETLFHRIADKSQLKVK